MVPSLNKAPTLATGGLHSRLMAAGFATFADSTIYAYSQALDRMPASIEKDARCSRTNAIANGSFSLLRARFVPQTQ